MSCGSIVSIVFSDSQSPVTLMFDECVGNFIVMSIKALITNCDIDTIRADSRSIRDRCDISKRIKHFNFSRMS